MTPWLTEQILFFIATGPVVWFVDRGIRRSRLGSLAEPLPGLALLVLVALVAITASQTVLLLVPRYWGFGFSAVAFGFYGSCFWAPLFFLRNSVRARSRRPWSLRLLALACLAIGVDAAFIEPDRLQTHEDDLVVERWTAGAPLRIVHASDLQTVGPNARDEAALEAIESLDPDLIVFCGDYAAGPFRGLESSGGPAFEAARSFVHRLHARLGVVAVAGHSESQAMRRAIFQGSSVHYLENESARFEVGDGRRIRVIGLAVHEPMLSLLDGPVDPDELVLVVGHTPEQTRLLGGRNVDIHFAGHTHGGQLVIPFWGPPVTLDALPRRYARGLFRWEDHWLSVCAGIGMEGDSAPRIRLFCPPEVRLLRVQGKAPAAQADGSPISGGGDEQR